MRIWICAVTLAVLLLTCASGYADEPAAPREGEPKAQAPEQKSAWTEKVQISGDLRYRHQSINEENTPERTRQCIRARVGADAKVNESINFIFRLATCSSSGDPTTTNQTLGEGFSHKPIWLDLAYFEARPEPIKGLSLYGGKMKNPFFAPGESELIWDSDVTPEGLAVKYSQSFGLLEPSVIAAGFWITERSADPDSYLPAGQASLNLKLTNNMNLRFGVGYFDYQRAKGYPTFFDPENSFGNTASTVGTEKYYANDFDELETFAEFGFKVGAIPVSIFTDYVNNCGADRDNTGYLAGFAIGKTKEPCDWAVRFNYRRMEKDAVIGVFTDSDCWGGGTNGKGAKVCLDFMIAKNTLLIATGFLNKKDLDTEQDYKKFQLDVVFKF
jgi:hypothetical protein